MSGQLPDASQKAYSVAQAQTNAKKMIGAVAKSLAESVVMYGDLMKDIALNNITVPQVEELTGGRMKLKYKTFLLENKTSGGKMADRTIKFDETLIGTEMTDEDLMDTKLKFLESSDYPHKNKDIRHINPELFAKFKYLSKIDVEEMFTRSPEYMQPMLMNLKQILVNDPYVNQQTLTRKLLYSFFQSEGEDLMNKDSQLIPGLPPMAQPQGGQGSQAGQQMLNKATAGAINGSVIQ
jgi:hypothetical protein